MTIVWLVKTFPRFHYKNLLNLQPLVMIFALQTSWFSQQWTVAPLGNLDHVAVLVSPNLPLNSKEGALFHVTNVRSNSKGGAPFHVTNVHSNSKGGAPFHFTNVYLNSKGGSPFHVSNVCSNSKGGAPFHVTALIIFFLDWGTFIDYLRDVPWENIFKMFLSATAFEFYEWVQVGIDAYIALFILSSILIHLHGF